VPTYAVKYGPILTGIPIGEIPTTKIEYSDVLVGPGSWSVSAPLNCGITMDNFRPGKDAVWILRDDTPVFSGPLWTAQIDVAGGEVTFAGEGWLSYLNRRILSNDVTFTATEQTTIAAALITAERTDGIGDVRIVNEVTATGVTRDRTYLATDRKTYGELLVELANVIDGAGFHLTPFASGNRYVTKFTTLWPSTGRVTSHLYELSSNIGTLTVGVDGSQLATATYALGAGVVGSAYDGGLGTDVPLLQAVVTVGDVSTSTTCVQIAQGMLAARSTPTVIPSISLAVKDANDGTLIVGDVVTVRAALGYLNIDGLYRITEYKVGLTPTEVVTLTLAPAAQFA